jgi:hypothetical protein
MMKIIRLLAFLLSLNFTCLLGQECELNVVTYAVPTSWNEVPSPDSPLTVITAIGCLMQAENSVLIIRAFVNGKAADMIAIPRGSIIKSTPLKTVEPDPDKLPTKTPTVRVKNARLHLSR